MHHNSEAYLSKDRCPVCQLAAQTLQSLEDLSVLNRIHVTQILITCVHASVNYKMQQVTKH